MSATITAAAIGAGASLLGSGMGLFGSAQSAKQQAKIYRNMLRDAESAWNVTKGKSARTQKAETMMEQNAIEEGEKINSLLATGSIDAQTAAKMRRDLATRNATTYAQLQASDQDRMDAATSKFQGQSSQYNAQLASMEANKAAQTANAAGQAMAMAGGIIGNTIKGKNVENTLDKQNANTQTTPSTTSTAVTTPTTPTTGATMDVDLLGRLSGQHRFLDWDSNNNKFAWR